MRMHLLMAALGLAAVPAAAQPISTFSRPVAPSAEALERLHLKTDWSMSIPTAGQSDGLARVQVLDEDQIAVQTKAGLLVVVDAHTGFQQWKYKYPTGFSSGFGVSVDAKHLYAVNVAKLYCFHRYTGLLEFDFDLPEAPSAAPVADGSQVYVAFTGSKIMAFALPLPPQIEEEPVAKKPGDLDAARGGNSGAKGRSITDTVADRYSTRSNAKNAPDGEFGRRSIPQSYYESGPGLGAGQRTASISALPSVVPPYTLRALSPVESLSIMPSLRQPYTMNPDYLRYNQYSPSIAVIPGSVARILELSNLRPQGIKPGPGWSIGTKQKIAFDPVVFDPSGRGDSTRVWITQTGRNFVGVSGRKGGLIATTDVSGSFDSEPTGPLAGPFAYTKDAILGFVALEDGQVVALDLAGGAVELPRYAWKANVGGYLNHRPLAAKDGVYISGDHSGVAKIDVKSGEVTWRTETVADRILAVNDESVYVRNRRGELLVFAKDRVHDAVSKRAKALAALDVAGYNVPIPNPVTDRILLGADNGSILCLRDAGAKYIKSIRIAPSGTPPAVPKPETKPVEPVPPAPVPPPK